jgi:Amt family ammonium transporter
VNAAGEAGGWTQFGRQAVLAIVGIAFPFVMTWIILWVTDHSVGLKVSVEDEQAGLDLSEHGEPGYQPVVAAVGVTGDGMMAAPDGPQVTEAQ